MRSKKRRLLANLYYLRRPTLQFLPVLCGMLVVLLLGGACFALLYDKQSLSYARGVYVTYCLIFMEHLIEFPDHWLLQFLYFVLPPLGLAVILDAIVSYSYHLLRRDELSPEWVTAMAKTMKNHVILFGLGKLGLRVLQELLRLEELVLIVERDPHCPNIAFAHKHGVPVRVGTGREADLLEELHLRDAKSVIMATDDDLANLEVAIDARRIKPDVRVVLRVFDQELAEKIKDSFDMKLAFSTWQLAAPLFATASSDRSIVNSFYVGDQLMVVAQLMVHPDSSLVGKTVSELRAEHKAMVLEIRRHGKANFVPDPDKALSGGDLITVQSGTRDLRQIHIENLDFAETRR